MKITTLLFIFVGLLSVGGANKPLLAGSLKGTVSLQAETSVKRPPRYYKGPFRSNRGDTSPKEAQPGDVVVWVEGVPGRFAPPRQAAVMAQEGEAFIPHVLPIQAGTPVEFPNRDNFYHNVFSVVSGDRFDLGRYAAGESAQEILSKPGIVVVRCEIHADMKAFIVVLENPYFAVPDPSGTFVIENIPPGTYQIKAWHPSQGEKKQTVVIPATGSVELNLVF